METNPFDRSKHETSSEETDDTSSSKKKKKEKRFSLFETTAEKTEKAEKQPESIDSLWRRMLGQAPTEQAKDKKEPSEETEDELDQAENDELLPLENLSLEEQAAVASEYIAARQVELMAEQTSAAEVDDQSIVAERAADIALLDAVRRLLERGGSLALEEPLQTAYDDTVRRIKFENSAPETSAAEPISRETTANQSSPDKEIFTRQSIESVNNVYTPFFGDEVTPISEFSLARAESTFPRAPEAEYTEPNRTGAALLLGGVVGYLLGRRHGRLKSEKQRKHVEEKLTAEVRVVQQKVAEKEQQIRSLAREAYTKSHPVSSQEFSKSMRQPEQPKKTDEFIQARLPRTEQIGSVTLKAAEKLLTNNRAESLAIPSKQKVEKPALRSSETLPRAELLEAAASVPVGATNLRRVYETNLISEQSLRHLMVQHERGGNIQAELKRELLEKEMSYERDPRMRNRSAVGSLAARSLVLANIDKLPLLDEDKAASAMTQGKSETSSKTSIPAVKPQQTVAITAATTLIVIIAVLLYLLFTSR
jgi:hypothetical protein